ncbi:hypothetical protein [Lentzea sp. HUAS12]|uniref:hypothetical protein n=1 Tax=Lentzea sp. HUAS12 TaxID=2951806 RepID=UPI00209FF085|nr:hypothetical protein [Lentzea sp. HUAS12]USX56420.1 hypothetical protein ND450_20655 [Lentzea sp. HUAS12]
MLIDYDWEPGVWIDGQRSSVDDTTDEFGSFAHCVHNDLLAARDAGLIPVHSEITIDATTIRPSRDWPPQMLLTIQFTGLTESTEGKVADAAFAILDRRCPEYLRPDQFANYVGGLCPLDEDGVTLGTRGHKYPPKAPASPSLSRPR